jgi:DNA polymerase elongation subunit (family B)
VVFKSVHHHGKQEMLEEIHRLMSEADAVVGWNSAAFDVKHLNREFLEAGMKPPAPHKDLDLMKVVKAKFKFPSNKLDYVAQKLGVGAKVKHSGFDLWIQCMAGNNKAWAEMKKYQIQDVELLVDLYEILLPWIESHPNVGLYEEIEGACANCGSTSLTQDGIHVGLTASYERFQCDDCGKWLKSTKSIETAKMAGAS